MPNDSESIEKLPPQSIEAEKSLLGSLMLDKEAIIKVADFLQSRDFYKKAHQEIYQAMLDLFDKGEPIDILSVSTRLREKKLLEKVGDVSYLTELVNSVPTASNILNYAKIVQKKRVLRDLIEASHQIGELGYNESDDPDIVLDNAEKIIFSIAQKSLSQRFFSLKESLKDAFERIDRLSKHKGNLRGFPTGFVELDNILAGLQKSDLIILASRPGLGKSSLATNIATNLAVNQKEPVGIFSLEMSKDQVIDRLIAYQANIDLWRLRTGRLSSEENDFTKIQEALGVLAEAPIYIDDTPNINVLQMRAMARRLQAEKGLSLIIVDYLQLLEARDQSQSMVQQMTEISRSLKALARELNIPVLAISQLSRAVEQRTPHIPRLSDLRESGCLAGDTLIKRADTGEEIPLKNLVGQTDIPVYSLDENWKLREMKISKVFSSGRKMVYELRTQSGFKIKASANHPFWKINGWTRLDELKVGDYIAIAKESKINASKIKKLEKNKTNNNLDVWPKETWEYFINPLREEQNISWRDFRDGIGMSYSRNTLLKSPIDTEKLQRIAQFLKSPIVADMARADIFWDKIVSIKPLKVEEVFDATVPKLHNFVANGIIVENSIEQDADVVLFIYREDKYKPETLRKNIADIIVAKHRNGPIGKAELYFDERRVCFRNLEKRLEEEEESTF